MAESGVATMAAAHESELSLRRVAEGRENNANLHRLARASRGPRPVRKIVYHFRSTDPQPRDGAPRRGVGSPSAARPTGGIA